MSLTKMVPPREFFTVDISATDYPATAASGNPFRCLWVGGAGDVIVKDIDGTSHTFVAPAVGMWHGMEFTQVVRTGTTATDMKVGR